ncbi:nicotinamide riboside kinase 1 isoform X4 [Triplophysa dalaica]|uniref:nicotinamide riboside kinase 1 isoform X4 n=1 Tax=Triplophysa dalaica TaxID=1582913 RepID=UPI0024DFA53F|nr:nicotinamide riboside kinase 1 isoform X4 [Triplophysa dalaica]
MRKIIIGIGGMTNGGKTTLSTNLQEVLPNSCVISQDVFFKDDSMVPVDSNGFKQYDTLDALHMDRMMSDIESWQKDPESFMSSRGLRVKSTGLQKPSLLMSYLTKGFSWRFPIVHAKREEDPPGYFDAYVWPMYLKNRKEMDDAVNDMVFLDGTQRQEELHSCVLADMQEILIVLQS